MNLWMILFAMFTIFPLFGEICPPLITEDFSAIVPLEHYIVPTEARSISAIIVHFTRVDRDTTFRIFQGNGYDINPRPVSAHYVIDRDGLLYRFVADKHIAQHARAANQYSIGIEHVALEGEQLTQAQEQMSAHLIAYLCYTYGIPVDHIYGHRWVMNGSLDPQCPCPGDLWKTENALKDWIMRMVVPIIQSFA